MLLYHLKDCLDTDEYEHVIEVIQDRDMTFEDVYYLNLWRRDSQGTGNRPPPAPFHEKIIFFIEK
jgi:hypothetical protein